MQYVQYGKEMLIKVVATFLVILGARTNVLFHYQTEIFVFIELIFRPLDYVDYHILSSCPIFFFYIQV